MNSLLSSLTLDLSVTTGFACILDEILFILASRVDHSGLILLGIRLLEGTNFEGTICAKVVEYRNNCRQAEEWEFDVRCVSQPSGRRRCTWPPYWRDGDAR